MNESFSQLGVAMPIAIGVVYLVMIIALSEADAPLAIMMVAYDLLEGAKERLARKGKCAGEAGKLSLKRLSDAMGILAKCSQHELSDGPCGCEGAPLNRSSRSGVRAQLVRVHLLPPSTSV